MKRKLILVGLLALVVAAAATQARAETADALREAATVALQKLDEFIANESARLTKEARATRELDEQLNSAAEQSALLNDRLKNRTSEIEQKFGALKEQIEALKKQADKLASIQETMTAPLHAFKKVIGSDQGGAASQRILAAISQDQDRAAKLLDAIGRRSVDDVGSLLRRDADGVRVQVGEMPESGGATVNFRVGNLVHCLSTAKRCRGAVSSLAATASREAPDPDPLLKQLHSLVVATHREATACNKRIDELLAKATAVPAGPAAATPDQAADLQRLLARLVTLQSTSSQLSRDLAAALDKVIRGT